MPATAVPNLRVSSARSGQPKLFSERAFLLAMVCVFCCIAALTTSAQSINDQPPAHINPTPVPQLDINHASISQLLKVPGITQIYAQRIVAGRPYTTKGQLKTSGILPPDLYAKVKDHLVAHRPKK
jgi:competence protein ComEA